MFVRFPAATRFPAGRAPLRCDFAAAAPGPGNGHPAPAASVARTSPLACHMPKGREAAYIGQAVLKEVTPCRTSREAQSGRTS